MSRLGLYMSTLEEGNTKDDWGPKLDDILHSEHYGKITPKEIKSCILEFKRDTSSDPDLVTLADYQLITHNHQDPVYPIICKGFR